jgi:hypothetical protein
MRTDRLRSEGHVRRRKEEPLHRIIMDVTPVKQRKAGRPKARWKEVGKNARALGLRSLWSTAVNREEWRQLLKETKNVTQSCGVSDDDDDDDDD